MYTYLFNQHTCNVLAYLIVVNKQTQVLYEMKILASDLSILRLFLPDFGY
jgi:hypothetical protein